MMNKLLVVVVACFAGALSITVQQAVTARCDTGSVRGLSQQLIEQINCLAPGLMTDMRGTSGIQFGANAFPYLQNNAAEALKRAVSNAGTTISVNSALRSLPQQYLLYKWHNTGRCNQRKPAAAPGGSNHNGGLAIDINNHAAWISKLKAVNFQWYGPSDKVHFTFKGSSQDIRGLSVKAFCQLWNYNNPSDTIPVVTAFGPTVERKLLLSPAEGFDRSLSGCAAARFSDALMANATEVDLMNKREDETTDYGPCVASNGISGKCIEESACAQQGGAGQPGNCPAPNGITCCLVGYVAPDIPDDDTVLVGSTSNIQRTNEAGVHLIQSFEGYKANFYIDAVGIRTIGYGHACHVSDCRRLVGKKSDGSTYTVTAPLSLQEANDLLRADLENLGFEDCVNRYVTANINDNQFSALVAFALNVGCGNFKKSTLLKRVNAGAAVEGTTGIRNAFLKFNKGNGRVLAGLTRRRNAEADLYAGRYSSRTVMLREHGVERGSPETDGSGSDCWHYGQKGVCLASAFCDGFRVEGLCPGTSSPDVKCCLRDTCDSGSGTKDGICGLEAQCSGTVSTTGVCKGATDLKCCKGTFNEPTTTCPDDATWSTTDRWCATNDGAYALGPFTRAMEDKCGATGQPDSVCKERYQFTWNGEAINLKKWPIDVARRIRGSEACPLGSSPNTNYLGYCVEEINERVPNTTDEFVGVKYVYGAMNADIIEGCKQFSGGLACNTPRYDGDFFRSLTQTYFQAIVQDYENTNETRRDDDETDGIPSDVPSIRTGETMNKLSDEHAVNDNEVDAAASTVVCFAVVLLALLF